MTQREAGKTGRDLGQNKDLGFVQRSHLPLRISPSS